MARPRTKIIKLVTAGVVLLAGITILFFSLQRTYSNPLLVEKTALTKYQFIHLIIISLSALFTFSAVVVALSKETILSFFKYANLEITNRDDGFIFENFLKREATAALEVESYETFLSIKNTGNNVAEGCTIQVQSIMFSGENLVTPKNIDVSKANPLPWSNRQGDSAIIYPKQSAVVSVVKITKDDTNTTPNNDDQSNPALITIGGVTVNDNHKNGTWRAVFAINSKNHQVVEYELEVKWDSSWRLRWTEMSSFTSIKRYQKIKIKKDKK